MVHPEITAHDIFEKYVYDKARIPIESVVKHNVNEMID